MLTTLIAALFTGLLVVGVPALSYSTARNPQVREMPRLALYTSAIFSQWLLTLLGWGVAFFVARPVLAQSFARLPVTEVFGWAVAIAFASLAGLVLVIAGERRGWLPQESELVYLLIPETARERVWAVLIVAPTAAFCEEFLFRGFLFAQLQQWLHSVPWAWIVCSAAFGLAHCYQGWSGMTRAAMLGALLTFPVARLGSLYPSMLAHWMIDAVALVWLGPWMVRKSLIAE